MTGTRLRYLLHPVERVGYEDKPILSVYREHGVIPKDSRQDNFNKTPENLSRYQLVLPSDLVVNKMKAWSGSVAVSRYEGIVSPDYLVCSVSPQVHPAFLHYSLRSAALINEMRMRSRGIRPSQERLYWDDLAEIRLSLPTLEQQRKIAEFLDEQMALLERAVTLRQQQAHLLEERGHSAGSAVTAGRGEGAPTGDRWYPHLPKGWRIVPLKYLTVKIGSGKTPSGGATSYVDSGVALLRSQNIHNDGVRLRDVAFISPETDADMAGTRVRAGDVLYNITGASLGRCTVAPAGLPPANVNQHVCIIRCADPRDADFVSRALISAAVVEQVRASQVGGNREGLNFEQLGNVRLAIPPTVEQREALARDLEATLERQARLAHLYDRQVELLQERKRALVNATVNGEFDVTAARRVLTSV